MVLHRSKKCMHHYEPKVLPGIGKAIPNSPKILMAVHGPEPSSVFHLISAFTVLSAFDNFQGQRPYYCFQASGLISFLF